MTSCPFCKQEVSPRSDEAEPPPVSCPRCGRPYQLKSGACPFCNREAKAQGSSPTPEEPRQRSKPPSRPPSKPPSVFPPPHARPSSQPPPAGDEGAPSLLSTVAPPLILAVLGVAVGLYAVSIDRTLGPHWLGPTSKAIAFVGGLLTIPLMLFSRGARLRAQLEEDGRAWAFPVLLALNLGLGTVALAGLTYGLGIMFNAAGTGSPEEGNCSVTASSPKEGHASWWVTDISCKVHGEFLTTTAELQRPERPRLGEAMPLKLHRGRLGIWIREE